MRKLLLGSASVLALGATVYFSAHAIGQSTGVDEKTFVFTNRPPAPGDIFGLWRESDLTILGTVTGVRPLSIPMEGQSPPLAARVFTVAVTETFASGTKRGPTMNPAGKDHVVDVMIVGGERFVGGKRSTTQASGEPLLIVNASYLMFLRWDERYRTFAPAFGADSVVPVHGDTFDITSRTPELRRHLTLYNDLESLLKQLRVYR